MPPCSILTATLTKAEIPIQEESGEDTKYIDANPFVRNFSYTVKDDKIYYREGAVMRECNPNAASAERIRKLLELRDTTRASDRCAVAGLVGRGNPPSARPA